MTPEILLSGPPGIGKSTVSRALARRLGVPALDLDEIIERGRGEPPATIIRARGEAEFRAIEASALESIPPGRHVLALGGGTLTTERGRRAARARGAVLGLHVDSPLLAKRLAASKTDRPLLAETTLEALLEARKTTYAAVDRRVSADAAIGRVVDRVAESAKDLDLLFADAGATKTRVLLGERLEEAAAGAVAALAPTRTVLVVVDHGVPSAVRDAYTARIGALFPCEIALLQGGESVKTWSALGELLERCLAAGCGRQSVVIGIGGGATCDLAALTASLLGRGAPVVLVPSTLLAQVDAAIGGKSAVNMNAGRNLVGTFHPASDVLVDHSLLASLDPREYRSGLAEVLKIALIADAGMFDALVRGRRASQDDVARAIRIKAEIVARDPLERGERKLLNLGHTLAHALEAASGFEIRHGEAVAIGIAAICRFSRAKGWLSGDECSRILRGLEQAGLPVEADPELLSRSAPFVALDKKAHANAIDLVCVHEVGKTALKRVSSSEVLDLVRFGGKA